MDADREMYIFIRPGPFARNWTARRSGGMTRAGWSPAFFRLDERFPRKRRLFSVAPICIGESRIAEECKRCAYIFRNGNEPGGSRTGDKHSAARVCGREWKRSRVRLLSPSEKVQLELVLRAWQAH